MKYTVIIQWSQEDECFVVFLPEFVDVMQPVTHGQSYEDAVKNAPKVIELLVESYREDWSHGMNISTQTYMRVKTVIIHEDSFSVEIMDGRTITVPLAWFPPLFKATPEHLEKWQICGGGYGIHWEEIDEDISIEGLLSGARSPSLVPPTPQSYPPTVRKMGDLGLSSEDMGIERLLSGTPAPRNQA